MNTHHHHVIIQISITVYKRTSPLTTRFCCLEEFPTVFVTSYSLGSKVARPCGPNQFYHWWFWASNHFNVGQYTATKYPIRSSESYIIFSSQLCSGILQVYWCVLRNMFITIITSFHLSTQGWTRDWFCPKPPKDMQKYQGHNESFGQISVFWWHSQWGFGRPYHSHGDLNLFEENPPTREILPRIQK